MIQITKTKKIMVNNILKINSLTVDFLYTLMCKFYDNINIDKGEILWINY